MADGTQAAVGRHMPNVIIDNVITTGDAVDQEGRHRH